MAAESRRMTGGPIYRGTCFNEAAAKWPRKVPLLPQNRQQPVASMRPRPNGRGKFGMRPIETAMTSASMRPRPNGRGKRFFYIGRFRGRSLQ
jgi:hypothetical protein